MQVIMTPRAVKSVERIGAWWTKNAEHPEVLKAELLELIEQLETTKGVGMPCPTQKRRKLRRSLLPRSKYHVYFEVNEAADETVILQVWGAQRGRGPKL